MIDHNLSADNATTDVVNVPGVLPLETLRFLRALHPEPKGLIELRLIFHNKDNPRPRSFFYAGVDEVEKAKKAHKEQYTQVKENSEKMINDMRRKYEQAGLEMKRKNEKFEKA